LFSAATAISLSLVPSIIAHFAADFVAGTLAPRYLRRDAALDLVEPARSPSEAASNNTMYIVI
jgi:hypothetical protein